VLREDWATKLSRNDEQLERIRAALREEVGQFDDLRRPDEFRKHTGRATKFTRRADRKVRASLTDILSLRGGAMNLGALPAVYGRALASAPLATKCTSAAAIAVAADTIAQSLTMSSREQWEWARVRWMVVWGALASGLANSLWFDLLARCFPDARGSAKELVKKVFVNQLVMAPALNVAFFMFVIWTRSPPFARMDSAKWSALRQKCHADFLSTTKRGTLFWTCAQTLNFKVLPPSLTVLSTNLFALLWTVYLSIVGNRASTSSRR